MDSIIKYAGFAVMLALAAWLGHYFTVQSETTRQTELEQEIAEQYKSVLIELETQRLEQQAQWEQTRSELLSSNRGKRPEKQGKKSSAPENLLDERLADNEDISEPAPEIEDHAADYWNKIDNETFDREENLGSLYVVKESKQLLPLEQLFGKTIDVKTAAKFDAQPFENKNLLIVVWASWCGPCKQQFPALRFFKETQKDLFNDFEILAISMDDYRIDALSFLKKRKPLNFPTYVAASAEGVEELGSKLEVSGMPFTVLVDKGLNIRKVYKGYNNQIQRSIVNDVFLLETETVAQQQLAQKAQ